jgi:hypothetical protein
MLRRNSFYIISLIFIGVTCFNSSSFAQIKLKKAKISDEISMKIASEFVEMTEEDMWQRSSSYRKAIALYSDMNRVVELGINHAFSRWEEGDIRILQNMYKASIEEIFDEVSFTKEEIANINGRDFAVFEFVSKIIGDQRSMGQSESVIKYYYIQYTIVDGGTLVFNFSCQNYVKEDWQETAGIMMNSIKIKE